MLYKNCPHKISDVIQVLVFSPAINFIGSSLDRFYFVFDKEKKEFVYAGEYDKFSDDNELHELYMKVFNCNDRSLLSFLSLLIEKYYIPKGLSLMPTIKDNRLPPALLSEDISALSFPPN